MVQALTSQRYCQANLIESALAMLNQCACVRTEGYKVLLMLLFAFLLGVGLLALQVPNKLQLFIIQSLGRSCSQAKPF